MVSSTPQTIQKVEGGSLQLSCDVSSSSAQHTHLSVSWYRQTGEQVEEVLSLSRDFSLRAGSSYAQRFSVGDVRLDKVGNATFRLSLFNLQTTDQGEFYCQGTEWIEDPDGAWFPMTSKRSQGSEVTVQATSKNLLYFFCRKSQRILYLHEYGCPSVVVVIQGRSVSRIAIIPDIRQNPSDKVSMATRRLVTVRT